MAPIKCSVCTKDVRYGDIRCDVCMSVFHAACVGQKSDVTGGWICDSCSACKEPLNVTHYQSMMSQFSSMMLHLTELSTSVKQCNERVHETNQLLAVHANEIANCKKEITALQGANQVLALRVAELQKSSDSCDGPIPYIEVRSRLERESNIIIHGLPRNQNTSDKDQVAEMLDTLVPEDVTYQILEVARIGSSDPPLIKVKMGNRLQRNLILKNKARLSKTAYSNVRVMSDLTPAQSAKIRSLRAEIKRRNQNGEDNLFIKFIEGEPTISRKTHTNMETDSTKRPWEASSPSPRFCKISKPSDPKVQSDALNLPGSSAGF